ncbi:MAG TPA: hypothetical protein VNM66_07900 [Thermodesulfobacteriota bacterium]|nr:hypothetical protein [Thermodesulfobacteriota bacterium]
MERIFWVACPECGERWYADWVLRRHPTLKLICPRCHREFRADEAPWLDERGTGGPAEPEAPAAGGRS